MSQREPRNTLNHTEATGNEDAAMMNHLARLSLRAARSHTAGRLLAVWLLLCAAMWAAADVIYSSGFESPTYNTGALVGQDSWLGSGPSGDEPVVQSSLVHGGSQAGGALRSGTDLGTSIMAYRDFTQTSTGIVVQAAIRIEDMAGSGGYFDAFYVYRDSFGGERATILYFQDDGDITVYDGGTERTVSSWVDDTWYQLDFTFDVPSQLFDLSINGSQVATNFVFLNLGATSIGGIALQEYGGLTGGGVYFDDLSVSVIPEPGSGLLFGLAASVLLAASLIRRYVL